MDKIRQIIVFVLSGSAKRYELKKVNTIVPSAKPINLDGHIWPSYAVTIFFTECIKQIEAGIPIRTTSQ